MSSYPSSDSGAWSIDSSALTRTQGEKKGREKPAPQYDTVVGGSCHLSGNFLFEGKCQLDCVVEGEISAKGDLYLGESADVKATIYAERLYVFGRLIGEIVCSERLEMFAGARVSGNVSSPRLVMHDGVVFDGFCRMDGQPIGSENESLNSSKPAGA